MRTECGETVIGRTRRHKFHVELTLTSPTFCAAESEDADKSLNTRSLCPLARTRIGSKPESRSESDYVSIAPPPTVQCGVLCGSLREYGGRMRFGRNEATCRHVSLNSENLSRVACGQGSPIALSTVKEHATDRVQRRYTARKGCFPERVPSCEGRRGQAQIFEIAPSDVDTAVEERIATMRVPKL
jgi:hypothetical protein